MPVMRSSLNGSVGWLLGFASDRAVRCVGIGDSERGELSGGNTRKTGGCLERDAPSIFGPRVVSLTPSRRHASRCRLAPIDSLACLVGLLSIGLAAGIEPLGAASLSALLRDLVSRAALGFARHGRTPVAHAAPAPLKIILWPPLARVPTRPDANTWAWAFMAFQRPKIALSLVLHALPRLLWPLHPSAGAAHAASHRGECYR
ncbi:hypothetical protein FNV43_RR20901 [Rhamnella rubrinervis]|uniref:Uncharacterized protein n=1 Tax=Rhamnella rubrinervis TaxID=2594499 RepID=A0A8K0GXE9_9ROSA|nr:hypothetical protein FNV43_RR20901 [Rhamnella rubrinervis]